MNVRQVYEVDNLGCSYGGSVTFWRTTDHTDPDPGELNQVNRG